MTVINCLHDSVLIVFTHWVQFRSEFWHHKHNSVFRLWLLPDRFSRREIAESSSQNNGPARRFFVITVCIFWYTLWDVRLRCCAKLSCEKNYDTWKKVSSLHSLLNSYHEFWRITLIQNWRNKWKNHKKPLKIGFHSTPWKKHLTLPLEMSQFLFTGTWFWERNKNHS